jgi:hypothetical protein
MKILPEHETLFTIMSKLIQVVWVTFELPMDEINISQSDKLSRDKVAIKKSTFRADDDEHEHYIGGGIARSSASRVDLSSVVPSTSFENINNDDNYYPFDLRLIDSMMIERDFPCRATGVLARGVY